MQSSKQMKAVSILSMAAAAVLRANGACGATLTLYYDNINVLDPAFDVVQTYSYASTGGNYAAIPTTINVPLGDTFQFGVDAVLTDDVNPDGGKATGTPGHLVVQPSYLGLSTLSIKIPSSDTNASTLAPSIAGPTLGTVFGLPDYFSVSSINGVPGESSFGPNNTIAGSNAPVPTWAVNTPGDTSPTSSTGGDVGDHFAIFAGGYPIASNSPSAANVYGQYGATTASFGNATDFFDSLTYTALKPGSVTLSPAVDEQGTSFWRNTLSGSSTVPSGYLSTGIPIPGDGSGPVPPFVFGTLPALSINITPHSIFTLTAASNGPPPTYGSLQALLSGTDGNGPSQIDGLNAATGYVEASGVNGGNDQGIYAFDVLVNGVPASTTQIGVLLSAINGDDNIAPAGEGLIAAASFSDLPTLAPDPFASGANLFLDAVAGASPDDFLGFDLSNSNDSNLVGYRVSSVAIVPEPMNVGLLALGGLLPLARRWRRDAHV